VTSPGNGLAILDAIVTGERNPVVLAQLRDRRVKSSEEVIVKSRVGDYRREHLFTLRQSLEAFRYYQQLTAACDQEIEEQLQNFDRQLPPDASPLPPEANAHRPRKNEFRFDMRSELYRIFGVDVTAVPAIHASRDTRCWRRSEPTGRSFPVEMPSLPGPVSVLTIRRAEEKSSPPKPAGVQTG
jgi:transposase